jgi:hypothetical protein
MKDTVINHANELIANLNSYQQVLSGAHGVTLRIASYLNAVALNANLLETMAPSLPCSSGITRGDFALTAAPVQTLALAAFSNAAVTAATIQGNISQVQTGTAKVIELVKNLTQSDGQTGQNGDQPNLVWAEIDMLVQHLENDADKSMDMVKDLLFQVKRLHQRIMLLAPGFHGDCICAEDNEPPGPGAAFPFPVEPSLPAEDASLPMVSSGKNARRQDHSPA